jgi:hypothetical protein
MLTSHLQAQMATVTYTELNQPTDLRPLEPFPG